MPEPELRRQLGLTSAVMITVGSVIGAGIFVKPYAIAGYLPDATWILGCWTVLGVVCLSGAFAYAELGAMFPEAGGQYAFLREGWGRFVAFLYGWCLFLVINSGTMAGLAAILGENAKPLFDLGDMGQMAVSAGMIFFLALINHFGVRWGALLQNLSTFAKLGALAAIAVAGFLMGGRPASPSASVADSPAPPLTVMGLVASCVAIFWAYEGWYYLAFNAAELKRPERDLPRGLIIGMVILVIAYVTVNAVYIHLVPLSETRTLATALDVPRLAVTRTFSADAGHWLVILICISIVGASNTSVLSGPRAFFAMARDGLMPQALTRVHPRWGTPTRAIWVQAVWAILLVVVLKTFEDIVVYVIFAALIFYALTVAAVYRLRIKQPQRPRPYRCLGYPWTPILFIVVALFVDVVTLLDPAEQKNALIGLGILAAGVPVYIFFGRRRPATG